MKGVVPMFILCLITCKTQYYTLICNGICTENFINKSTIMYELYKLSFFQYKKNQRQTNSILFKSILYSIHLD